MANAIGKPPVERIGLSAISNCAAKGHTGPDISAVRIFRNKHAGSKDVGRDVAGAAQDVIRDGRTSGRRIGYALWRSSVLLLLPAIIEAEHLAAGKVILGEVKGERPLVLGRIAGRGIRWRRRRVTARYSYIGSHES